MDFALNDDQIAIRTAVEDICAQFGDEYWLKHDREGGFPEEFYRAMAEAGWLGMAMMDAETALTVYRLREAGKVCNSDPPPFQSSTA